jgi:hypothetical protein
MAQPRMRIVSQVLLGRGREAGLANPWHAGRKLSSNPAKRMHLRSSQLGARCNPPGQVRLGDPECEKMPVYDRSDPDRQELPLSRVASEHRPRLRGSDRVA